MILLFGAGGQGKVVADILVKNGISEIIFYDQNIPQNKDVSYKIINKFPNFIDIDGMIISIGNNHTRKKIAELYNVNYINAFHPFTSISKNFFYGVGNVIMAGAIVNPSVKIGNHCIINTNVTLEHDCIIGDFAHLSPNSTLCGNVEVGIGSHIGASSVIIPGIKIGSWSTIGAGAVVIDDVPDNVTVVGNPARIIKNNF